MSLCFWFNHETLIDSAYSSVSTLFSVDKFALGVAVQTVIKIDSSSIVMMSLKWNNSKKMIIDVL